MSFAARLAGWMTTSSSIIGAAVATPTFAAAMSGALPWSQAALPLLGAAIAIALPQHSPAPPIPAPTLAEALNELARLAVLITADAKAPTAPVATTPSAALRAEIDAYKFGRAVAQAPGS